MIDYDKIPEKLRRRCPECGGTGEQATSHVYTCPVCGGRRWVPADGVEELLAKLVAQKGAPT